MGGGNNEEDGRSEHWAANSEHWTLNINEEDGWSAPNHWLRTGGDLIVNSRTHRYGMRCTPSNIEHWTLNIEHWTLNIEYWTLNIEHRPNAVTTGRLVNAGQVITKGLIVNWRTHRLGMCIVRGKHLQSYPAAKRKSICRCATLAQQWRTQNSSPWNALRTRFCHLQNYPVGRIKSTCIFAHLWFRWSHRFGMRIVQGDHLQFTT